MWGQQLPAAASVFASLQELRSHHGEAGGSQTTCSQPVAFVGTLCHGACFGLTLGLGTRAAQGPRQGWAGGGVWRALLQPPAPCRAVHSCSRLPGACSTQWLELSEGADTNCQGPCTAPGLRNVFLTSTGNFPLPVLCPLPLALSTASDQSLVPPSLHCPSPAVEGNNLVPPFGLQAPPAWLPQQSIIWGSFPAHPDCPSHFFRSEGPNEGSRDVISRARGKEQLL